MAIKFAIIIPAYKAHDTIRRALDSIVMQTRVHEVKVYIIDDCDPTGNYNYLYLEYEDKLLMKIERAQTNGGPTGARNLGLLLVIHDCIPYILFMDADDCFFSPLVIHYFHKELLLKNWDFIAGNFILETDDKGLKYYNEHQDRQIWLFGKMYKTRLIRDNNIRFFLPSLNLDVGFNLHYSFYTDTHSLINQILYMWKWRDESITRKNNGDYGSYCMIGLYKNCLQVYDKLSKDKNVLYERYKQKVAQRMIMMYVDWNTKYNLWKPEVSIELFDLMRQFYIRFYKPIERQFNKRELMVCGRGIFLDDLDAKAKIPFIDFLKQLNSTNYKDLYYLATKKEEA